MATLLNLKGIVCHLGKSIVLCSPSSDSALMLVHLKLQFAQNNWKQLGLRLKVTFVLEH